MTWGIIGALDAEISNIRGAMIAVEEQTICGCIYYSGNIGSARVVAVCCSVGTINAAVCATIMAREWGVDAIVNVGIAGSASKELNILDVVVAEDVVFHDADLDILVKYYPFQKSFPADPALSALCCRAIEQMESRPFQYRKGRIASGDVFVNNADKKADIIAQVSPMCIEMEGAAVGQAAFMNGVPFLVIRTLSDNADNEADNTYDDFLERAADNSARIVLDMIHLHAQSQN